MARTLYEKFRELWQNKPDKTTPITAEAMMHIEDGILKNSENMALKEIYDDEAISMGRKRDTNIGNHSYAVGYEVVASESDSHAEGYETKATGPYAHAEGLNTIASGAESHAEGFYTQAVGDASHAEGCYTQAMRDYQHVQGKFNEPDNSYAHIVGGGTSDNDRKNIHTLDWEGNARFAGNVSSNRYNLNDLGDAINKLSDTGDEDISSQCYAYASGQRLEITIPIDGIFVNGNFIAGAFFFGIVNTNLPPMLFNANILVIKYPDNHTQIEGMAELVNTIQSYWEQFGRVFEGSIQLSQLTQNSATTCIGTVQITFDLGFDLTTASLTLFKSNKYYYPIARVWNELTENGSSKGRLKTIEEIEANTEEGYDVDALPVKEINSKFGGITEFIVDEDSGKITGYKTKVGADTVFPFSSRIDLGKITGHSFSYSGSATTQYTMTTDIGKIVNISGFIGLYIRVGNTGAVSPSTVSIYIDTSTNNNNWSNVVTSSPCNRPGFSEITPYNQDKVILSSTVNARYVRIRITSTDRETVTINGSVIYSD